MKAKLCGMKTREAAEAAEAAGADLVGFIFWAKSRRAVTPEQAAAIGASLRRAKKVGVFVDAPVARVNEIAAACKLDFVQLHGHEDADYARQVRVPVIKAYRFGDGFDARAAAAFPAELILLDSGTAALPGGPGKRFAWREAAEAVRTAGIRERLLVAGGVAAENLPELYETFHPYGVDVSGSLEVHGEKSIGKIREFMQAVQRLEEEAGGHDEGHTC